MSISVTGVKTGQLAGLPQFASAQSLLGQLARALLVDATLATGLTLLFCWPTTPTALLASITAFRSQGVPGPAIGVLLLTGAGLAACLLLVAARDRSLTPARPAPSSRLGRLSARLIPGPGRLEPASWAATWPQAVVILAGAALTAGCLWWFWPHTPSATVAAPAQSWFVLAAVLAVLSFPFLVCERYFATIPPDALPELAPLRALVCLPIAFLLAEAAVCAATGLGLRFTDWAQLALALFLAAITAELALRSLAIWFLPPPGPAAARAAIDSLLARLVRRRSLSPTALADTIRDQFGLDFSRSWAIAYVRSAFAPVALLLLLLCWVLSGVIRIDLKERGVYERFGAPVAVLDRGLHIVLPWPFGVVRHIPYGVVQTVSLGLEPGAATASPDNATAEGPAPASANRLWDQAVPTDIAYIIASEISGRQSVDTIEVDLQIMFRIGLDDRSALAATYDVESPDALVRRLAGTLLAHFFASETLTSLLGEDTQTIAAGLQAQLQSKLDALQSGLEIVAINIAAIHPPSGAAEAYRNVQAAEIIANTTISTEQGRAETTASLAQRDAANAINNGQANAAETLARARVERTNFGADEKANQAAGEAFLLERYFADLRQALAGVQLEILDDRLDGANRATIDLRPPSALPGMAASDGDKAP